MDKHTIDADYYRHLAFFALRKPDNISALEYYSKAILSKPDYSIVYFERASLEFQMRMFDEALVDYKKVIELEPDNWDAYYGVAAIKRELGDMKGYVEGVVNAPPKKKEPILDWNTKKAEEYLKAIKRCDDAVKTNSTYPRAYLNRAFVNHWQMKYLVALKDYDEAIKLGDKDAFTYMMRGKARENLHDLKSSLDDLDLAIKLDPNDAEAYMCRGRLRAFFADYRGAVADKTKEIELNPARATSYRGGEFFASDNSSVNSEIIKRLKAHILRFTEEIKNNPNNALAYINRGYARYFLGKNTGGLTQYFSDMNIDMRKDFEKAHELDNSLETFEKIQQGIQTRKAMIANAIEKTDGKNAEKIFVIEERSLTRCLKETGYEKLLTEKNRNAITELFLTGKCSLNAASQRWKNLYPNGPEPKLNDFCAILFESYFKKGFVCEYCGRKLKIKGGAKYGNVNVSIDHRTPLFHGGDSQSSNLAVVCWGCNTMKGTISEDTYRLMVAGMRKAGETALEKWFVEGMPGMSMKRRQQEMKEEKMIRDKK